MKTPTKTIMLSKKSMETTSRSQSFDYRRFEEGLGFPTNYASVQEALMVTCPAKFALLARSRAMWLLSVPAEKNEFSEKRTLFQRQWCMLLKKDATNALYLIKFLRPSFKNWTYAGESAWLIRATTLKESSTKLLQPWLECEDDQIWTLFEPTTHNHDLIQYN